MCARWGRCGCRNTQNPTRRHSSTSYAPGHTRDTHAEGEGHAALGLGRSAPPTPAPCRPPARIAVGPGAARLSGRGRGGPASAAPSAPAVGGGEDIVAAPPHPRQASPRAPPGAPLTREREWGSVRGRVGSNSNLSDLKGAGRPPKIERDRSCARPRAGTAPLRAPRPPQGEWKGTPRPSLSPSLPAPPPALVPPLSPPPLQRLTPKFPAPRADTLGARSPPLPPACTAPPSPAPPARAHRPSGSLRARAAAVAWPTGAVAGAGAGAAARS